MVSLRDQTIAQLREEIAALKMERDTLWTENQRLQALVRETILRLRSSADALDGRA